MVEFEEGGELVERGAMPEEFYAAEAPSFADEQTGAEVGWVGDDIFKDVKEDLVREVGGGYCALSKILLWHKPALAAGRGRLGDEGSWAGEVCCVYACALCPACCAICGSGVSGTVCEGGPAVVEVEGGGSQVCKVFEVV